MFKLATVYAADSDGLLLIFDGETQPSQKHYTRLASCEATAGDRVLLAEMSGTYVAVGVLTR